MGKYRRKPIVIDAIQWTGENDEEIKKFAGIKAKFSYLVCTNNMYQLMLEKPKEKHTTSLMIVIQDGFKEADIGDFIIRGVHGEIYPCKPDIFKQNYDKFEY